MALDDKTNEAVGEVIFSSITGFTVEMWQDDGENCLFAARPNFGSFLKTVSLNGTLSIVAVVHNVLTSPLDKSHRPSALKLSREELQIEQPHIFALLKTEIHAQTIGYVLDGQTFCCLPPQSPQVHDFVYPAKASEICRMTEDLSFLRLLSLVVTVPADELLAASVREAYKARSKDRSFLVAAGQAIAKLFRDDYDRLVSVLLKIKDGY